MKLMIPCPEIHGPSVNTMYRTSRPGRKCFIADASSGSTYLWYLPVAMQHKTASIMRPLWIPHCLGTVH